VFSSTKKKKKKIKMCGSFVAPTKKREINKLLNSKRREEKHAFIKETVR
tara:strand:- start:82 stop:228 length:147 start_codon:yes stop_codon:yes gene_type:complete